MLSSWSGYQPRSICLWRALAVNTPHFSKLQQTTDFETASNTSVNLSRVGKNLLLFRHFDQLIQGRKNKRRHSCETCGGEKRLDGNADPVKVSVINFPT